jgi:hypothetical protein
LRDWIPCVLQYVKPYVSSEDIDKGTRWSVEVAKELSDSTYGIICVTADNQGAPWLNFEAGALSKAIDKSYVTPFLLNLKASELKNGPLIQFQATAFTQDEVRKLIESVNNKAGDGERVEPATVKRTFDKWWPELEKELGAILQEAPGKTRAPSAPTKQEAMIEELLDLARGQQRYMSSPESLLPPQYLEWAIGRARQATGFSARETPGKDFHRTLVDLMHMIDEIEPSETQAKAAKAARRLHNMFHELEHDERDYEPSRRTRLRPSVKTIEGAAKD